MNKFQKYPSTIQYSGVVKQVLDHCSYNNLPIPTLTFSGSTKIHGTNSGIGYNTAGEVWFQSRERVLEIDKDNAGFCLWGEHNKDKWKLFFKQMSNTYCLLFDNIYIFGEFFGPGIHKGVAVNQIQEKKFGIFRMVFVKYDTVDAEKFIEFDVDPVEWNDTLNDLFDNVFVVDAVVPPIELTIDFNKPHLVQNTLLELTLQVEKECPVGKYFGVVDGCTIGEGLVWSTADVDWLPRFKTKGLLHSSSKVVTLRELTEAEISSKANSAEFVEYSCTKNRLEQGIDKLGEMGLPVDIKSMGTFLKFISTDILRECRDVLVASNINLKDVMPDINRKSKEWFMVYLNSEIVLAA